MKKPNEVGFGQVSTNSGLGRLEPDLQGVEFYLRQGIGFGEPLQVGEQVILTRLPERETVSGDRFLEFLERFDFADAVSASLQLSIANLYEA